MFTLYGSCIREVVFEKMACNPNATELFSKCNGIDVEDVYILATIRGSVSIACFSLCILTLILELVYFCRKHSVSTTLRRMFVYLTFSSVLYTAVLSFHLGYRIAQDYCYFCVIVGFLDEYTGLVQLCLTAGVVVKLLHKLITTSFCEHRVKGFSHRHHLKIEAAFVTVSFMLPLLIAWIPFAMRNGHYGPYGPWCWISRMETDCSSSLSGLLEELLIWYVLFGVVSILSLLCTIIMVAFLIYTYYKVRKQGKIRGKLRTVITDYCLLLPFLIIFTIICLIEVSVVIFKSKYFNTFGAWTLYAIATPIGGVAVPIGFLIFFVRKQKDIAPTKNDHTNTQETMPASDRFSPNSFTDDQDRPNFLSRSDEWSIDRSNEKSALTFTGTLRNFLFGSNRRYGTLNT